MINICQMEVFSSNTFMTSCNVKVHLTRRFVYATLSSFEEGERLITVITVVIYTGGKVHGF